MPKAAGQDSTLRERQPSLGERLRLAREATGASVDAAGRAARIPVRYVHMLEDGRYPMVSDPAYLVSFLRRYARHLGLDVERVAREFMEHADAEAARETAAMPDPRKNGAAASASRRTGRSVGAWLLSGLLAVGLAAAGYQAWVWKSAEAEISRAEAPSPALEDPPAEPVPAAPAVTAEAPASEVKPPVAAGLSEMANSATAEVRPPAPVPARPVPPAAAEPSADTPPAPPVPGVSPPFELQITAVAREVWVWISVDGGQRRVQKLMAGETMRWAAERGYLVSIDDAAGIRASLNGIPLRNLGPGARKNLVVPSPDLFTGRDR